VLAEEKESILTAMHKFWMIDQALMDHLSKYKPPVLRKTRIRAKATFLGRTSK
jgi:hypothetical protein